MTTTNVVPINNGNGDAVNQLDEAIGSTITTTELLNDEQSDAAAIILNWQLDADLFLRLMYSSDNKFGQALVLFELVKFHKRNGIDAWCARSAQEIIETYPKGVASNTLIRYAISELVTLNVIESNPVVRNTKRQFRLNPVDLLEMVNSVSSSMPGLDRRFGITPV